MISIRNSVYHRLPTPKYLQTSLLDSRASLGLEDSSTTSKNNSFARLPLKLKPPYKIVRNLQETISQKFKKSLSQTESCKRTVTAGRSYYLRINYSRLYSKLVSGAVIIFLKNYQIIQLSRRTNVYHLKSQDTLVDLL